MSTIRAKQGNITTSNWLLLIVFQVLRILVDLGYVNVKTHGVVGISSVSQIFRQYKVWKVLVFSVFFFPPPVIRPLHFWKSMYIQSLRKEKKKHDFYYTMYCGILVRLPPQWLLRLAFSNLLTRRTWKRIILNSLFWTTLTTAADLLRKRTAFVSFG